MNYLILSASLNPKSKSRELGCFAKSIFDQRKENISFFDLKDLELPFSGAPGCYEDENSKLLSNIIKKSDCILICSPIYNYDLNSVIKNALDLTGFCWENKIVGFLCVGGGQSSYMSPMSFINSLMLNCRSFIIPRYVYATGSDFKDDKLNNSDVENRINELVDIAINITCKLS